MFLQLLANHDRLIAIMLSHAEIKQSTVDNIRTITEEYTARSEIRERINRIARVLVACRRPRSTTEYWEEGVLGVKYRCLEVGCSERQRVKRREELEKYLKDLHSFGPLTRRLRRSVSIMSSLWLMECFSLTWDLGSLVRLRGRSGGYPETKSWLDGYPDSPRKLVLLWVTTRITVLSPNS
jgi:hypothetical protein